MSKLPCPELGFQKNETGCWEMEPEGEHVAEVRPGASSGPSTEKPYPRVCLMPRERTRLAVFMLVLP